MNVNIIKKILFFIVMICSILLILAIIGALPNKNTLYLKKISANTKKNDVICEMSLSRLVKEQNKFITYKTIPNESKNKRLALDILENIGTLQIDKKLHNENSYSIELVIIYEIKGNTQTLTCRVEPNTLDVYIPEHESYYRATDALKSALKEIMDTPRMESLAVLQRK